MYKGNMDEMTNPSLWTWKCTGTQQTYFWHTEFKQKRIHK